LQWRKRKTLYGTCEKYINRPCRYFCRAYIIQYINIYFIYTWYCLRWQTYYYYYHIGGISKCPLIIIQAYIPNNNSKFQYRITGDRRKGPGVRELNILCGVLGIKQLLLGRIFCACVCVCVWVCIDVYCQNIFI